MRLTSIVHIVVFDVISLVLQQLLATGNEYLYWS